MMLRLGFSAWGPPKALPHTHEPIWASVIFKVPMNGKLAFLNFSGEAQKVQGDVFAGSTGCRFPKLATK